METSTRPRDLQVAKLVPTGLVVSTKHTHTHMDPALAGPPVSFNNLFLVAEEDRVVFNRCDLARPTDRLRAAAVILGHARKHPEVRGKGGKRGRKMAGGKGPPYLLSSPSTL